MEYFIWSHRRPLLLEEGVFGGEAKQVEANTRQAERKQRRRGKRG
ncbi:hypothetical protein [Thermogemmatispora sp.]|nr:hypothetical protein [Thermogemmatispora sp.]